MPYSFPFPWHAFPPSFQARSQRHVPVPAIAATALLSFARRIHYRFTAVAPGTQFLVVMLRFPCLL